MHRTLLTATLLLALTACGGGGSGPPTATPIPIPMPDPSSAGLPTGAATTTIIGAAGGTLSTPDGAVTILIPAGALSTDQSVGIQPIENTTPAGFSRSYRLTPEGTTFAAPAHVTFHYTAAELGGAPLQTIRVGSRTQEGYWTPAPVQHLDLASGSITVDTAHFSDWGSVPGMQLSPDVATVRVGQSLPLTVVVCDDLPPGQSNTHGFPVLACDSNVVLNKVASHWSVNGAAGGNATIGTVGVNGSGEAVYTAPAKAPNPNLVAVSAQVSSLVDKTLYTLVSTVKVTEPAKGWQGKVTYHEEGGVTYPPSVPMTGHIQQSFLYDETQTITEAALDDPTDPEDFTLKLGAVATGSVAESAYTREDSSTCSGGYVTEHWWASAADLNGKDSVESHLHVDPDGSYSVHLEPIGANGERHETHRDKVTAVCPPPDPSYDESGTWSGPAFVNGQDANLEGRIDPQHPDTISGTVTRAGEQGEVPTTVTIHWEFHRLP